MLSGSICRKCPRTKGRDLTLHTYITTMVPTSSAGTGRKDSARAASTHPQPPAQEEQPAPEAVPEQAVEAAVVRGDATWLIYIIKRCAKLRKDSVALLLRRRRRL